MLVKLCLKPFSLTNLVISIFIATVIITVMIKPCQAAAGGGLGVGVGTVGAEKLGQAREHLRMTALNR